MSVLAYPRFHFKGKCLINPATGNNDDVTVNIDTVNARLLPALAALSDEEAREWMIGGILAGNPINNQLEKYLRCSWNYFGNLSVQFVDAVVTSVVGKDGQLNVTDAMVGKPVNILSSLPRGPDAASSPAVICDLDPLGTGLTQIFVGGLSLGDEVLGLSATHDARAFVRWAGWRNTSTYQGEHTFPGASATWQFAMPRRALEFHSASPGLAELKEAVAESQGIVVQFCFYLVEPQITDAKLISLFQQKQELRNPAEGFIVGTLGIWEDREFGTELGDRLLLGSPDSSFLPATARFSPDAMWSH